MADRKPLYISSTGLKTVFQTGDTIGVAYGGTGATTAAAARTNLGLVIGTNVQAWNADLDALAAFAGTGFAVRTGSGAWAQRSLTAPAAGFTITNNTGVAGNPTFALANDLSALEGLASTGFAVRTATDTWAQRSIATASSARITVSNGDGISGNPTLDLATLADGGTGSFLKITRDTYGRVSGTTAVVASDITSLVDSTYVNVNGDLLTGYLTAHADPTNAMHVATKQYVDSIASGQAGNKTSVRVASTANQALSGGTAYPTIDGVATTSGDYVLLKDQTTGNQNGIYVVGGTAGAWTLTRANGWNESAEMAPGLFVFVSEGSTQADQGYTLTTNAPITLGTTSLVFTQTSGAGQITAGNGLSKVGNTLSVETVSSSRITVGVSGIDLASGIATPGTYTKVTVDTYGRVTTGATATPADIGAQPADSDLTAIAALSTNGVAIRTGTGTWTTRTITGTGSRISVTNGDGISGNPTIDLASGVATPGTYTSVTVDTYGRVTAGTTSNGVALSDAFTNANGSTINIGQVVYASAAGSVSLARADALATCRPVGLVGATSIANAASGQVYTDGTVTATTTQWDAVTGETGGLSSGAVYFLSNATAGGLTQTAPTTGFLVAVGQALSSTKMKLFSPDPVQL